MIARDPDPDRDRAIRSLHAAYGRLRAYAKRARTIVAPDGTAIDADYMQALGAVDRAEHRASLLGVDTDSTDLRAEARAAHETASEIFIADRRAKAESLRAR